MVEKKKQPKIDYSLTKREVKYSDFVRLQSRKNAFLLTFSQRHPEDDDLTCVAEIVLPPEVAASLGSIIIGHVAQYEQQFKTKISPKGMVIEAKPKEEIKH